jgi:hypothetical protein
VIALKKVFVAGLAVGAVALAGCAPQGKDGAASKDADVLSLLKSDPSASLQTAASKVSSAKSMSVTMTGEMMGQPVNGHGAVQFGAPAKADLVMSMGGKDVTLRLLGTVEYIELPAGQASALGGKKWLKFDLAQAAKLAGMDASQFADQMNNMDPSKQVRAMLASKQLKAVGEETVDGVRTVHYSGTVTLEEYLDQYSTPASRAKLKDQLTKSKLGPMKTDLWVDEKYQIHKGAIVANVMNLTYSYSDYGKPVNVVAPPAAETADLMELFKGLQGKVPA